MSTARTILKNVLSLTAAQVLTKLLAVGVAAYTARTLGAEQYGRWNFAAIFAGYFSLLASLGVDAMASRHVARDRSQVGRLVAQVVPLRLMGSLAGALAVAIATWMLPKPVEIKWLILVCYVPLALGCWNLTWVFLGLERLELVAVGQLLEQIVNAGAIVWLVRSSGDVMRIPVAATLGVVAGAGCLLVIYLRRYRGGGGRFERGAAWALVRETVPFGLTQVLGQLYYNFDSVMLSFLRSDAEVGWYNAAYRLVIAVVTFRFTIIYSLNPTFARLFAAAPQELERVGRQVQRMVVLMALPIGVGGMVLAGPIIALVFGPKYTAAADALQVLVWSPALLLLNLVGPVLLSAAGRWRTMLKLEAVVVGVNLGANLFLIPRWGIVGAAAATVLADIVSFTLHRVVTRSIATVPVIPLLVKPCLCAAAMGLVLWPIRTTSVFVSLPVGAVVYVAGLLVTGALQGRELRAVLTGHKPW